jgi:hypothetical protein
MSIRFFVMGLVVGVMSIGLSGCGYSEVRTEQVYAKITDNPSYAILIESQHKQYQAHVARECAASKSRCEAAKMALGESDKQMRQLKHQRCEEAAWRAEGGLIRPIDYIPIIGGISQMTRTMDEVAYGKAAMLGEKGKKVYDDCMAGP